MGSQSPDSFRLEKVTLFKSTHLRFFGLIPYVRGQAARNLASKSEISWLPLIGQDPIPASHGWLSKIFGYPGTPQKIFEKKLKKFSPHKPAPLSSNLNLQPYTYAKPVNNYDRTTTSEQPPQLGEEAWVPP